MLLLNYYYRHLALLTLEPNPSSGGHILNRERRQSVCLGDLNSYHHWLSVPGSLSASTPSWGHGNEKDKEGTLKVIFPGKD